MIARNDMEVPCSILLIENDSGCRKLAENILSHLGCRCIAAQNGAEALRFAQAYHIDLVITDIVLPDCDGLQLAQSIRSFKKYAALPLIMVTGLSDAAARLKAVGLDGTAAIQKPYRVAQFKKVVMETLEQSAIFEGGLL